MESGKACLVRFTLPFSCGERNKKEHNAANCQDTADIQLPEPLETVTKTPGNRVDDE